MASSIGDYKRALLEEEGKGGGGELIRFVCFLAFYYTLYYKTHV